MERLHIIPITYGLSPIAFNKIQRPLTKPPYQAGYSLFIVIADLFIELPWPAKRSSRLL